MGFILTQIFKHNKCIANSSDFEVNCGIKRTQLFHYLKELEEEQIICSKNYFEKGKQGEIREISFSDKAKEQLAAISRS